MLHSTQRIVRAQRTTYIRTADQAIYSYTCIYIASYIAANTYVGTIEQMTHYTIIIIISEPPIDSCCYPANYTL